jgi:hypothetical protein
MYEVEVALNGIMFIPNFMKIGYLVQIGSDERQTAW